MEFLSIALQFFLNYQTLLIPLLALGLANMIVNTYSLAFGLFSILCFALFIYFGIAIYAYVALAGITLAFILKYFGL